MPSPTIIPAPSAPPDNTVSTAKIVAKAVTTAKIDDGAVDTTQLADASVTPEKLAAGVIGFGMLPLSAAQDVSVSVATVVGGAIFDKSALGSSTLTFRASGAVTDGTTTLTIVLYDQTNSTTLATLTFTTTTPTVSTSAALTLASGTVNYEVRASVSGTGTGFLDSATILVS